jgi:hypothetical protein
MAQYDDINVRGLSEAAIVSVLVTFLTVLLAQVFFYWIDSTGDPAVSTGEYRVSNEFIRQQQEALIEPATWVDKTAGRVAIPIDLAKQLTVEQYQKTAGDPPSTVTPES